MRCKSAFAGNAMGQAAKENLSLGQNTDICTIYAAQDLVTLALYRKVPCHTHAMTADSFEQYC